MFIYFIIKKNNLLINYNSNYVKLLFNNIIHKRFTNVIKKFSSNFFFKNFINLNLKWLFMNFINLDFYYSIFKLLFYYFSTVYFYIKIFKAHGINMRIVYLRKKLRSNLLFLRLGYSHGLLIRLPKTFFFRIFKRRYFIISSLDLIFLNNLTYHLRTFRKFFKYKLIGIKLLRDSFKLKIGKKKSF